MSNKVNSVISILALIIAVGTGGAYAANNLIPGSQIRKNSITTKQLKNSTVRSADIGEGEVHPGDVTLPPPEATAPEVIVAPVTTSYTAAATVAEYTEAAEGSVLQIEWSGIIVSGPATNCEYQLRINGVEAPHGGELTANQESVNVSTSALFPGLPPGLDKVEIWARATAAMSPNPTCVIGSPLVETSIVVNDNVT